jgi:hypothetical protein
MLKASELNVTLWKRTLDGAIGYTYEARLEQMYLQFIQQAARWRKEDPDVQIRLADIGFSRGAEQAAGFARLVHERGIQDPSGRTTRIDEQGRTLIEYTKPPLVPPGQIAQAVGLLDPVGTGEPREHDRRLPPSVISGFQIKAEDERRGLFKSTSIIDQGITADGRFLGVTVGGAHSDVGGGYHRNGLPVRAGNLMIDYLNALSDRPYLRKDAVPEPPRMSVVHQPEKGMWLYRVWNKVDRRQPEGVVETLAPDHVCQIVSDCRNAEHRDEVLARHFEFRATAAATRAQAPQEETPAGSDPHARLDRLLSGQVDPAARAAWDRDVAAQRSAAEAPLGRAAIDPPGAGAGAGGLGALRTR